MPDLADRHTLKDSPSRIGIGIAVSILLHFLLLSFLRDRMPIHSERRESGRMILEVFLPRLKQPESVAPAVPEGILPKRGEPRQPQRHIAPQKKTHPVMPAPPVAITPVPSDNEQRAAPGQPSEPSTRDIDPEAARASVPEILKQLDRERIRRPVDQLAAKPLYGPQEETRLGQRMAKAGRPDCLKTIQPGGLLAPLFMLAEKKGSGCKW